MKKRPGYHIRTFINFFCARPGDSHPCLVNVTGPMSPKEGTCQHRYHHRERSCPWRSGESNVYLTDVLDTTHVWCPKHRMKIVWESPLSVHLSCQTIRSIWLFRKRCLDRIVVCQVDPPLIISDYRSPQRGHSGEIPISRNSILLGDLDTSWWLCCFDDGLMSCLLIFLFLAFQYSYSCANPTSCRNSQESIIVLLTLSLHSNKQPLS